MSEEEGLVILFRPVGQPELELIRKSGFRSFPARLPDQPIFYPILIRKYAEQIARNWNARDPKSGLRGYVLRFRVRADYLAGFEIHTIGDSSHREYWIPAEELDQFNRNIVGKIEVLECFDRG
jgi:hypothetical protein